MAKGITDLKPGDLMVGNRLVITYTQHGGNSRDEFIVTQVGRIAYGVDIRYGASWTRNQLIERYGRFADAAVEVREGN